jgi:hypothetical protein
MEGDVQDNDDESEDGDNDETDEDSGPGTGTGTGESKSDKDNSTLWPTSGVRNRWIHAIKESKTLGEIALGLTSFIEYGRNYGVFGDDPLDNVRSSQSKNLWTKSSKTAMTPTHKSSRLSLQDDYKRPSRQASKKISSYAEFL